MLCPDVFRTLTYPVGFFLVPLCLHIVFNSPHVTFFQECLPWAMQAPSLHTKSGSTVKSESQTSWRIQSWGLEHESPASLPPVRKINKNRNKTKTTKNWSMTHVPGIHCQNQTEAGILPEIISLPDFLSFPVLFPTNPYGYLQSPPIINHLQMNHPFSLLWGSWPKLLLSYPFLVSLLLFSLSTHSLEIS